MMSLRYHVVSLAAVIVALGIGILIGASVVGDRGMMKQQFGDKSVCKAKAGIGRRSIK